MRSIYDPLAFIRKVDCHQHSAARLDLTHAPFGVMRVAHEHAGGKDKMGHGTMSYNRSENRGRLGTMQPLAELLASRICHDLVSPLGAIGNGIELMTMTDGADSQEISLIAESVETAQARIRLFRAAFGAARADQVLSAREIAALVQDYATTSRHWTDFDIAESLPRPEVKLVLLLLMCVQTSLPWGGSAHVGRKDGGYVLSVEADRMRIDEHLWHCLETAQPPAASTAADVHFALAALELGQSDFQLDLKMTQQTITIQLRAAGKTS